MGNPDLGDRLFRQADPHVLDGSFIFGILYPLLTGDAVPEGFAPFLTTLDLKKRTQELRPASPSGGSVEWMIGAYYTKEESDYLPEVFALRYESAERIELAKTHFRAYALGWNVSDYRGQQIVSHGGGVSRTAAFHARRTGVRCAFIGTSSLTTHL